MDLSRSHLPTGAFALADGLTFVGAGHGTPGIRTAEIVFNTAMTGYQEILTDPSYAGQIVTFTFPHIGNVGVNREDVEAQSLGAAGAVFRAAPTPPANWRAEQSFEQWLSDLNLCAVSGVDTRRLTRHLRNAGAQNAALQVAPDGQINLDALRRQAIEAPTMIGRDLATEVSSTGRFTWIEGHWAHFDGHQVGNSEGPHVVAVDYGIKSNILRLLVEQGCRVTVVPATSTAEEIQALAPDGILLGNGPGDPAATGRHAVPMIRQMMDAQLPVFGICLGHQMLGLALGAKTKKMTFGHHGANHPVKDVTTGRVEITSQNHGFAIDEAGIPNGVSITHRSLFDGTIQGIELTGRPVFSVQYHPEASPGPADSRHLFQRFVNAVRLRRAT